MSPRVILQRRIINTLKILGERLWMRLRERIFNSPLGPYLTIGRLHLDPLGLGALGGLVLLGITLTALS